MLNMALSGVELGGKGCRGIWDRAAWCTVNCGDGRLLW